MGELEPLALLPELTTLLELIDTLRHRSSGLYLVLAGSRRRRAHIADALAVRLSDFEPSTLDPHRDHLDPTALVPPVAAPARLFMAHLDPDDPDQAGFLRGLNLHREWLLQPGLAMVLLLEGPAAYLAFQRACPDLWAFRSQTVTLLPDGDIRQRDHDQRETLVASLSAAAEEAGLRTAAAWPLARSILAGVPAEALWERLDLWRGGDQRHRLAGLVRFAAGAGPLPPRLSEHRRALEAIARNHGLGESGGAPPLSWPDWESFRAARLVGSFALDPLPLEALPEPPWPAGPLPELEPAGESLDRLLYANGAALVAGGTRERRWDLATTWALLRRGRYDGVITLETAGGLVRAITSWLTTADARCLPPREPEGAVSLLAQAIGDQRALVLLREVSSLHEVDLCRRALQTADILATIPIEPAGAPTLTCAWTAQVPDDLRTAGLPSASAPPPPARLQVRWGRRYLSITLNGRRRLRQPLPSNFYDRLRTDRASRVTPAASRVRLLPGHAAAMLGELLAEVPPAIRVEMVCAHTAIQALPLEALLDGIDPRPPRVEVVRRARSGPPFASSPGPLRVMVACLDPDTALDRQAAEQIRARLLGSLPRVRGLHPCPACPGTLPALAAALAGERPHILILGMAPLNGAFLFGDGHGGTTRISPARLRSALAGSHTLGLVIVRPPASHGAGNLEAAAALASGLGRTLLWAPGPEGHDEADLAIEGLLRDLAAGEGSLEAIGELRGESGPDRPPGQVVFSSTLPDPLVVPGQPAELLPPSIDPTPLNASPREEPTPGADTAPLSPSSLRLLVLGIPALAALPRAFDGRLGPATGGLPHLLRRLAPLLEDASRAHARATANREAWDKAVRGLRRSLQTQPAGVTPDGVEVLRRLAVLRQPIPVGDLRSGALGELALPAGLLHDLHQRGLVWPWARGPAGPGVIATEPARALLEWLRLHPDGETHVAAASYWETPRTWGDPVAALQEARHHWREAGVLQAEERVTEALMATGLARGRPALALQTAEAVFERARGVHDTATMALAALHLGIAQLRAAPYPAPARQWFAEALEDACVCADGALEAGARWGLAHLDRREAQAQLAVPVPSRGGIAQAIERYRRALNHLQAAGPLPQDRARLVASLLDDPDLQGEGNPSHRAEAETLWDLSLALERSGDICAALVASRETQAAFSRLQSIENQALAMLDEGRIYARSGDPDRSTAVLQKALSKLKSVGAESWAGYAHYEIGRSHGGRGWHEQALESFLRAKQAFFAAGWRRDQARADSMAATALTHLERYPEARAHAAAARAALEALADPRWSAAAQEKEAWISAMSGDLGTAIQLEEAAVAALERLGEEQPWAYALGNLAGFRRRVGDLDGALRLHEQALETFRLREDLAEQAWSLRAMAAIREAQGRIVEAQALTREADQIPSPIQVDVPPQGP